MQTEFLGRVSELFKSSYSLSRINACLEDIKNIYDAELRVNKYVLEHPAIFVEQELRNEMLLAYYSVSTGIAETVGQNMIDLIPEDMLTEKYCSYLYYTAIKMLMQRQPMIVLVRVLRATIPVDRWKYVKHIFMEVE